MSELRSSIVCAECVMSRLRDDLHSGNAGTNFLV